MSKESAKKFLDKIENDAKFREQIQKAKGKEERQKVFKAHHISFTEEEFSKAYQEKTHRHLSHKELEQVRAAGSISIPVRTGEKISCDLEIENG